MFGRANHDISSFIFAYEIWRNYDSESAPEGNNKTKHENWR